MTRPNNVPPASIPYVSLGLSATAIEQISLPAYKGSTFRGAFGATFKRVVCALRKNDCSGCILKDRCVYSYVFESPPPPDTVMMKKYPHAPHPFLIEPPLEEGRDFPPGSNFNFAMILIGRAIEYLPYFIYTFQEMGSNGIGRGRGKYVLESVHGRDGEEIFSPEAGRIHPVQPGKLELFPSEIETVTGVTLEFITPTRMLYNSHLVIDLEFHILIRGLLRRLSSLYYFHCAGDPEWDFKGLIRQAEAVAVKERNLHWYDWERYSNRQKTKMKLGGFTGTIKFTGDLGGFLPLLRAAEVLHVGRGTTFGLGKMSLKQAE